MMSEEMNDELPKGCRTCQNRLYMTNICGRTGKHVSLTSKSEWTDYLKRWRDAVGRELATAERMLKRHPDKKTKAEVKKLRSELVSIRARPLGRVVGECPYFKRHTVILPMKCFGDYPNGPCDGCAPSIVTACMDQTEQTTKEGEGQEG